MTRIDRFILIAGLLLAFGSTLSAQERNWEYFTPASGEWTIFAPGEMTHDPNALETLSTKGGYSYSDTNGFFAVVYEESASWKVFISKPFLGSHYKKIRNGFVKNSKGTLIKDIKFKNKSNSGREFSVKIPDGRMLDSEGELQTRYRVARFRVFFQGNRCYMIVAVLPENEINSFAIDNYFDSFVAKK